MQRVDAVERVLRRTTLASGALLALGIVPAALAGSRLASAASFDEFVRDVRADESALPAVQPGQRLTHASSWSIGTGDPFAAPIGARGETRTALEIAHEGRSLLSFAQDAAWTQLPDCTDRASFATRTARLEVDPAFHAVVRVWLHRPAELVGTDSGRRGALEVDAWLFAGPGASTVELLASDSMNHSSSASGAEPSALSALAECLDPTQDLPPQGMQFRIRAWTRLTHARHPGGTTGIGRAPAEFHVSTDEFSYELSCTRTEGDGSPNPSSYAETRTLKRSWKVDVKTPLGREHDAADAASFQYEVF
ncbi:MAG: hypothetical protein EPO68_17335 [Planctomycetota bacterium]|nr:MAG: hypothetical protein EPO68_17335 [Planctomycetota bacterium]